MHQAVIQMFFSLFTEAPGQSLPGIFDPWLVLLSVFVAIFASVLALCMVDLATRGDRSLKMMTIVTGSIALGFGVWAMHFIAMLAFNLCTPVSYDPVLTGLSMLPSLAAAAVALFLIAAPRTSVRSMLTGGVLVGGGIGAMHYIGMSALRMEPILRYDPWYFALSIVVAIVLAVLALWIRTAFSAGEQSEKQRYGGFLAAGTVMGLAIAGMHYTGMAAARFYGDPAIQTPGAQPETGGLVLGVTMATLLVAIFVAGINALLRYRALVVDLRASETSYRASESRIRAITATAVDGIISIWANGEIVHLNAAAERMFGWSEGEIAGRKATLLIPDFHGQEELESEADWQADDGLGQVIGSVREVLARRRDGTTFPVRLAVGHAHLPDGEMYVGYVTDITKQLILERAMADAKSRAEQAAAARADFLANMSHEIRTPMNGVIAMVEVLQQSGLKTDQNEIVGIMQASALSLLAIIDDILDFAKIEAGKLEIESSPMAIGAAVEQVCQMLSHLAATKAVDLTLYVDPAIPPEVDGDALRLKQILINLTNNAIKFSNGQGRQGRVTLRVLLADRKENSVTLKFCVVDNGIGMDEGTISRLFSAFSQADVSTSRRFGGTGLGLAISNNLARLMGGAIAVESSPGEGSVFTLTMSFPLHRGDDDASSASASLLAGLSCLVVGGTDSLARYLASYLTHDGAHVHLVPDLEAAAEWSAAQGDGLSVWIVDLVRRALPTPDQLRAIAGDRDGRDTRFLLIGRGSRRCARVLAQGCAQIDGNPLSHATLRKVVATIAGLLPEEDTQDDTEKAQAKPVSREEALHQGRLLLVAEDNKTNQEVLLRQFDVLGYKGDMANNGAEAFGLWRSGNYAMLLTDLHMPEMDGYELTAAIRAEEEGSARRFPIIALTANALRSEAEHCRAAGMDGYVSKPAQLEDLRAVIEKHLPPVGEVRHAPPPEERPPEAVGSNVIDMSTVEALADGDPKVVEDLLEDFRATMTNFASDVRAACVAEECPAVRTAASKLKLVAYSMGASSLAESCQELETAALAERTASLPDLMAAFMVEVNAVEAYLGLPPAIDLAALSRILGLSDEATLLGFIGEFLDAAKASLAEVEAAAAGGDPRAIKAASHGAKGEAKSVGAPVLAKLYTKLEQAAREEAMADVPMLVSQAAAELDRIAEFLKQGIDGA